MKSVYPEEKGSVQINGHKMEYVMRRSKGESAFGIQGSRIFALEIKRDGVITGTYEHGWSKKIDKDDEESTLCLQFLIKTYGREKRKEKKK